MPILWNAQAGLAGIRLRTREQSFVGMTSHIWGIVSGSAERGTAVTTLVACCYFLGTDCFLYLRSSTLCYLAIILKGLPDPCSPTATLNFLQCGPISRGNPLPPSPLSTFLYYTRAYLVSLFFAQSLPPVSTVPLSHIWLLSTQIWFEGLWFLPRGGQYSAKIHLFFSWAPPHFLSPTPVPKTGRGWGYHLVPAPSICLRVNV